VVPIHQDFVTTKHLLTATKHLLTAVTIKLFLLTTSHNFTHKISSKQDVARHARILMFVLHHVVRVPCLKLSELSELKAGLAPGRDVTRHVPFAGVAGDCMPAVSSSLR
jgi:hypothetical protein